MKIGDRVWVVTSVLREGSVFEIHPMFVRILCDGDRAPQAWPLPTIGKTVQTSLGGALKECEENRDYWERQISKLTDLSLGPEYEPFGGKSE
jgi:hypothetical protein